MKQPNNRYWVGEFLDGTMVLFDSKLNTKSTTDVILWEHSKQKYENYIIEIAKPQLKTIKDQITKEEVISDYRLFVREVTETNYNERMITLGIDNSEVRSIHSGRFRRVAHCYSCKLELDNIVDIECAICGWILCRCGACGCGFGMDDN